MKGCRLSSLLDVYIRRIDRQNAQLDALSVSCQELSGDMRAWRSQMEAENAASREHVAMLLRTKDPREALDAWIAQFDEDRRPDTSGVTQSTG